MYYQALMNDQERDIKHEVRQFVRNEVSPDLIRALDRDEIKSHLPEFFRQHIARRALVGDPSIFNDPESRSFCEALVDLLDPRDELRFSVLGAAGK